MDAFASGLTILLGASFCKCGRSFKFNRSLLQQSAADLPPACSLEIPQETFAGGLRGEATSANIGQAVAVGVGTVRMWMPGEISSETVGRGEAGTFADKDEAKAGPEMEADGIANGHPALLHQTKWGDNPPCTEKLRK